MDIKGMLVGVVLPMLLSQSEGFLEEKLDEMHEKEPEWHKTTVVCAHRLISVHGAELAASTENKYDDAAVSSLVNVLEEQATKYSIVLAN